MSRQQIPIDENHLRQGSPSNSVFAESVPRFDVASSVAIAATGVVHSTAVPLQIGDFVSSITFVTGGTAAATPTAGFVALYSPAGALLGQSADFATTARAANTAFTVPLVTPVRITVAGLYYVAISFTAGTVPTLAGAAVVNAVVNGALGLSAAVLAQTHGSAVGATAPATIATPTTVANIPYLVVT